MGIMRTCLFSQRKTQMIAKKNVHNYLQQETPPICFDEPSAENSRLRVKIVQKENVDVDANDDQFRCIQN